MRRAPVFMRAVFIFFLVSGFCSILYELVWLRLSMAQFGVTTALVSIVLSTFMAGLGLGSWVSGYLIRRFGSEMRTPALRIYALTELLIGLSAILVPYELSLGGHFFVNWTLSSSLTYYLVAGLWVAFTLVPWCACMGATIPVVMFSIRRVFAGETPRSFSYLYLANVLGAIAGSVVPLFFIELIGFHGALKVGAALNLLLALSAFALSFSKSAEEQSSSVSEVAPVPEPTPVNRRPLVLLFLTGLTSMGMEVVWIRLFTPYVGTVVYAFARILCVYLLAMFLGSMVYRRLSRNRALTPTVIWAVLGVVSLLPLVTAGPDLHMGRTLRVLLGLGPCSAIFGFVTPLLVDRWSGGDPNRAGRAYAVNVVGCILGPLVGGFFLLPSIGERWSLLALSVPWILLALYPAWLASDEEAGRGLRWKQAVGFAAAAIAVMITATSKDYAAKFAHYEVRRDNTATIIVTGEGMDKHLLVNGFGITELTPGTKIMAHLPLASLGYQPHNALVICFGMGTTFRSLLSWGIPTTAVELVPSVPKEFGYFHADGPQLLQSPLAHVVIDDGRRYLSRTQEQFDVITLDPPPPVEAAGSSMLYSTEFYAAVRRRLTPTGILQTWLPAGDATDRAAVAKALKESFPYVRVYFSLTHGRVPSVKYDGEHFLASMRPIPDWTPEQLVSHMPKSAVADMMEWGPQPTPEKQFAVVLESEFPIDQMIAEAPNAPPLQDDRPVNEYYVLRQSVPGLTSRLDPGVQAASNR
ncbi:MAG TPA: fused MFS/spermidine synthase [Silvibacterium sp.]|nr:fused MFS/spermidine synthase [Silvibacterium sp.]